MKAWRCDVGGVFYHVAAPTLREAVGAYYSLDEGVEYDDEDGFVWGQVPEAEARMLSVKGDGDPGEDLWTLVQRARGPEVVACSEWP